MRRASDEEPAFCNRRRAKRSHCDQNFGLSRLARTRSLLIFCPEPRSNCFLDVLQSFLFSAALRNAARKRWALRDHPAIFGFVQRHMEYHACMLTTRV